MTPNEKRVTVPQSAKGMRLLDFLAQNGIFLSVDCGGRGVCGKCRVKVLSGALADARGGALVPEKDGHVLACKAYCTDRGAILALPQTQGGALVDFSVKGELKADRRGGYGMALDIGTTTLACALVDLEGGQVLDTLSSLNPQRAYGADVMSRITACSEGKLSLLQSLVCRAVADFYDAFVKRYPQKKPTHLSVVGNTTMLHIFCGESPASMGKHPFTPVFLAERTLSGQSLGLPFETVTVLPSASAFVGADVTAGAAACDIEKNALPALFVDIGTNGEMLLCQRDGSLYAASTAAGPALEGAGITFGVGGIDGAVCALSGDERGFRVKTVGNAAPIGICGSGLLDTVAYLLDTEQLEESGYLEEDFTLCQNERGEPITLNQKDIRALQLAKGALRAGIEALLSEAGLQAQDLACVYVAGGLGYYMNLKSAVRVGLFPSAFLKSARAVGNTALFGAVASLLSKEQKEATARIARTCKTLDLNAKATFGDAFIEHMAF